MVSALQCHDDIKVCRIYIGWLNAQAGGIDVTPTLPVSDMAAAVRFYEAAGFDVEHYEDGFAFVHHHEQSICNLDLAAGLDPASNHAGCYIITGDVDDWHARFIGAGFAVTPVEDMPWGMHEFTLTDPSGNHLRIGRTMLAGNDRNELSALPCPMIASSILCSTSPLSSPYRCTKRALASFSWGVAIRSSRGSRGFRCRRCRTHCLRDQPSGSRYCRVRCMCRR